MPIFKKRFTVRIGALLLLLGLWNGCTNEEFDPGLNGNAFLRFLRVKNANLIPDYQPTIFHYTTIRNGLSNVEALVQPYIFYSTVRLNGQSVRMETNIYGFPVETDITHVVTNDYLLIDITAEDGLHRQYSITFLDETHDAAINAIVPSAGSLYPAFTETIGPGYRQATYGDRTNEYQLYSQQQNITLSITKTNAGAGLTVNGTVVGNGTLSGTSGTISLPSDGSVSVIFVTNISQAGDTTNVKLINACYVHPTNDTALTAVRINGGGIRYLPDFNRNSTQYSLVLEDTPVIALEADKATAGATLTIRQVKDSGITTRLTNVITSDNSSATVSTSLTVGMGDQIQLEVVSSGGTLTASYLLDVTMFTAEEYTYNGQGINGGIGHLLQLIRTRGEITLGSGFSTNIYGVLTAAGMNYDGNGYMLEDGAYAVYIYDYNDPVDKDGNPLKVGYLYSLEVKAAKMWRGLPEINAVSADENYSPLHSMQLVDKDNPARYALHYTDGSYVGWQYEQAACRIFRFKGYVVQDVDDSGRSRFTRGIGYGHDFRIFGYADLADNPGELYEKLPVSRYIRKDVSGTFFGPVYYDSGEGYMMMLRNNEYIILD